MVRKYNVVIPYKGGHAYVSNRDKDEWSLATAKKHANDYYAKHGIHAAVIPSDELASSARAVYTTKNPRDIHIDIGAHNVKSNPRTAKKQYYAVKISAPNNTSGNPQRGWLVFYSDGHPVDFVDEGYEGEYAVTSKYKGVIILVNVSVTSAIYKQAKKTLHAHGR